MSVGHLHKFVNNDYNNRLDTDAGLCYREYPAKRDKRKRHNSAMEKDISNLKKVLESPMKTILPCFDKFLPPVGLDSP